MELDFSAISLNPESIGGHLSAISRSSRLPGQRFLANLLKLAAVSKAIASDRAATNLGVWRVLRSRERYYSPYMSSRVLIIEDEVVTQHLLTRLVESEGHAVSVAQSCAEAEGLVMRETYGLILLDLVLGQEDGLAILRRIRDRQRAPIVIISARSDSNDIITGLELGADDYVLKPFDVAVLRARLRSHLRRGSAHHPREPAEESFSVGKVVVDCGLRDALVEGQPAGLTQKEFQLLLFLARRMGRAVRKEDIEDEIFDGEMRSDKILAVYVRRLREKLEADPQNPRYLHTVRGFGYRLAVE